MQSKSLMLRVMATALVLLSATITAATPSVIKGRITDSEGAAIAGALVLLHPDPAGAIPPPNRPEIRRETDSNGLFDAPVQVGFYDVCVMATAFTPDCRKIRVTEGRSVKHDVRLKVDKLIVKEIGDRFVFRN